MNIVAVTSCPTGIAHSQMAAENIQTTAEARGHDVHVEVQGAMGTQDELPADAIAAADVAVITADTAVSTDRFEGLPIVKRTVKDGVNDAEAVVREAEALAGADADGAGATEVATETDASSPGRRTDETEGQTEATEGQTEATEGAEERSGGFLSGLKKRFT
jgi:PTS system fructose-specific IIB component